MKFSKVSVPSASEAIAETSEDLLASYDVSSQLTSIEDMIAEGADMQIVLRLLCLASITAGGIKTKTLDNIKREFLQVPLLDLLLAFV